jgi:hypothetical protein
MNANKMQFMEHRWGTRTDVHAQAKVMTTDGLADGMVRNASLSGAYIETAARPVLLSRVAVRPSGAGGEWLDACVVRVEPRGVALEWLDPPLHALAVLLAREGEVELKAEPAGPVVSLVDRLRESRAGEPAST